MILEPGKGKQLIIIYTEYNFKKTKFLLQIEILVNNFPKKYLAIVFFMDPTIYLNSALNHITLHQIYRPVIFFITACNC